MTDDVTDRKPVRTSGAGASEPDAGNEPPDAPPDFDVQGFARGINELLILATLRDEAKHGYQIGMDVEKDSNGLFSFKHGTLYPILHRLENEGLVRGSWSKEGGRRRKTYTLTTAGRRHLRGGTDRVHEVMAGLMRLLRGPDEAPA